MHSPAEYFPQVTGHKHIVTIFLISMISGKGSGLSSGLQQTELVNSGIPVAVMSKLIDQ